MSYNVDTWKTKRLENLVIPLKALYKHKREDWHPKRPVITNAETGEVELECGCEKMIAGVLKDGLLHVTGLDMSGEGSGTFLNWILEPALEESTGILEAVRVWEGGDTVDRLIVRDGNVTTESVEL